MRIIWTVQGPIPFTAVISSMIAWSSRAAMFCALSLRCSQWVAKARTVLVLARDRPTARSSSSLSRRIEEGVQVSSSPTALVKRLAITSATRVESCCPMMARQN